MEYILVCVKDRGVDGFLRPFVVRHRNEAIRSFVDEINKSDSEMRKHADDYDLYYVDSWDDVSGITVHRPDRPELLVRGKDCVVQGELKLVGGV